MKQLLSILFVFLLVIILAGCGQKNPNQPILNQDQSIQEPTIAKQINIDDNLQQTSLLLTKVFEQGNNESFTFSYPDDLVFGSDTYTSNYSNKYITFTTKGLWTKEGYSDREKTDCQTCGALISISVDKLKENQNLEQYILTWCGWSGSSLRESDSITVKGSQNSYQYLVLNGIKFVKIVAADMELVTTYFTQKNDDIIIFSTSSENKDDLDLLERIAASIKFEKF